MLVWDSFVEWTSERFHRASDATRERFAAWWDRQQQPAWLRAARYEIGWQFEEWRWRFGVWWSGKAETISQHSGRSFARIAELSERAGSWLAAHIAPLANRCAAWFYARSVIASERRATLKSALAELRDRRMEQLREILGVRFSDAAGVAARGIGG